MASLLDKKRKVTIADTHVDIKPPSIPSNLETIFAVSEKDAVFNTKGYYADLDNRIDEQKNLVSDIALKCLAKIKKKSLDDMQNEAFGFNL
mmetsp:Transcript_40743/g.47382  ORF Transcript_40743/g.47382 Transcript_40743/m.47382 type:complete len:91 (-) Transcript_40743:68-340(-)